MRISFILSSLWLSGGVRVIVEFSNRLALRGHKISIVAPGGTIDNDMSSEINPLVDLLSSKVIRTKNLSRIQSFNLALSLAQRVPVSDIVISTHTPTTISGLIASRLLKKGKLVWLYQDYREMFINRPFEDWLMRHALRWHELALVVSDSSRQELLEYSPGKVRVVGEGISDEFFSLPPYLKKKPGQHQEVLFLGDMRPRKGLFDFIQAAEIVYKNRDIKLLIVSKEDCHIASQVPFEYIYRPSRSELSELYATCDLFVSASWWESFGLPPLEAMACGAPVVLTDSRGVREYAKPGYNCIMVPPQSPTELANAMTTVLDDLPLAECFRQNGPLTAASFTWDNAVDRFTNALICVD